MSAKRAEGATNERIEDTIARIDAHGIARDGAAARPNRPPRGHTVSSFTEAVAALIAQLEPGHERPLRAYDYLETRRDQHFTMHARDLLVRERDGSFVLVTETRRERHGTGHTEQAERSETRRLSERQLVDALSSEAHLRAWLRLPDPTADEQITRVLERLRDGERLEAGGADDGGGHSGRRLTGERRSLRFDGAHFVYERVSFEEDASGALCETADAPLRYDETALRAALSRDDTLRALMGIAPR